jgi:hypothetical protein
MNNPIDFHSLVLNERYYIQMGENWRDRDANNEIIGSGRIMATYRGPGEYPGERNFNNLREIDRGNKRGLGNSGTNLVFPEIGEPVDGEMTIFDEEQLNGFVFYNINRDEINNNRSIRGVDKAFYRTTGRNDAKDLSNSFKDYLSRGGIRRKSRSVNKRNTKRNKRTTKRRQKKRKSSVHAFR